MLWKAVRCLLHSGPGAAWYEGLNTDTLATGLCNFFVDNVKQVKVKEEHSLHDTSSNNRLTEPTLIKPQRSFKSFACIMMSEVERLIKSAPMKSSPLDQLPISAVKSCSAEFSVIIAHITNTSFKAGRFPSACKAGLVVPLLKKPGLDTNDFKSFRLITNLMTLSKLLECLALVRLKPHVVTSPNYSPLQSAYLAMHTRPRLPW